jgi:hypothetical protein
MPRPPRPLRPHRCAGCARWVDLITTVIWGDQVGRLCCLCAAWYKHLRLRPESLHLTWQLPGCD